MGSSLLPFLSFLFVISVFFNSHIFNFHSKTLLLLTLGLGKTSQRGPKPGELCLKPASDGSGAPVASFHGEGDCKPPRRHGGAPLATLRGATARVVENVLLEAGFEVEHLEAGQMDPRAVLDYCSSTTP